MSNIRRFCCDDETGEVITYDVNAETGEPLIEDQSPPCPGPPRKLSHTPAKVKYNKFPRGYMSKTRKFQALKANIIAGSNTLSHRLLLLPTLMFFPGLLCVAFMILEVYLHVRCHKKNKKNKDTSMYYQSPFHVITSIFCAACRECDAASKIGQLQDKRRHRYDYFRRIAI